MAPSKTKKLSLLEEPAAQVKGKLQLLLDDRSVEDPGAVTDVVPDEDQHAIINEVLQAYKGTDAAATRRTRAKVGPTVAELRAELERAKAEAGAKEEEYKAREVESRAALEDVQGRLKAIEKMMRVGFGVTGMGVTAASDGASFIPSNFLNLP